MKETGFELRTSALIPSIKERTIEGRRNFYLVILSHTIT